MTKSSMAFGSSSVNPAHNVTLARGEMTFQESTLPLRDPEFKEQELKAALLVIKIIMKLDAAQPFNFPVNPIALGIPDYFDIIETPMDFGTICKNLENGLKYMNSKDVFRDVELIWENCCKYNKNGAQVLVLMKHVKKKFVKFWSAAELYMEQPWEVNGNSHLQRLCQSNTKISNHVQECPVDQESHNPVPQLQDQIGPSQPHISSSIYSQRHQPQLSYNQLEHSLQQPDTSSNQPQLSIQQQEPNNGNTHLQPPMQSNTKRKWGQGCSVVRDTGNPALQLQDQIGPSKVRLHNPSSVYSQRHQPQLCCNQPEHSQQTDSSSNQSKPSLQQLEANNESNVGCSNGCPLGQVTDNPMDQLQVQMGPGQVNSHQPLSFYCSSSQSEHSLQQLDMSSNQSRPLLRQPEENNGSTSRQRNGRGRGPTRCLKLWNRDGKRIHVDTNELGQPVGLKAPKLTSFLGTIARDGLMAPLTYADWRSMPIENKEKMWQHVELKFDIDLNSKSWVLKSLSRKWKDWKSKLKSAHYNTHATDAERLADRDERVLPDQWATLVQYWGSEEGEKRSAKNKANRSQQKFNHTTGTKSFARIREEQRAKRPDGKEPSQAELFILTRTRKDGRPVNQASSVLISQLREQTQQQGALDIIPLNGISSQMGKDRHVGVSTNDIGLSTSNLGDFMPTPAEAVRMVSESNAEVHELRERMLAMEKTCAQMVTQMSTMMAMMSSMQRAPDKLQSNSAVDTSGASEDIAQQQQQASASTSCHPVSPQKEVLSRCPDSPRKRSSKRSKMQSSSSSSKDGCMKKGGCF